MTSSCENPQSAAQLTNMPDAGRQRLTDHGSRRTARLKIRLEATWADLPIWVHDVVAFRSECEDNESLAVVGDAHCASHQSLACAARRTGRFGHDRYVWSSHDCRVDAAVSHARVVDAGSWALSLGHHSRSASADDACLTAW